VARPTIGILQVFETENGLLVVNMTPNGPAENAGLKGSSIQRRKVRSVLGAIEQETVDHSQADLIIAIDDTKVKQADDLLSVIETKRAGEVVRLTIVRSGKALSLPVTLGSGE
jgi:S1-C subfamily serine protease